MMFSHDLTMIDMQITAQNARVRLSLTEKVSEGYALTSAERCYIIRLIEDDLARQA